ncbi:MAG TPA: RNA 2'-phosphotransferase [Bacillota bacterium]|nr:RNA 2'-phosphotransferase [Bacillota bacterium]
MNYQSLSKKISYILRHAPWEFGLELDENGWVSIDELLNSLGGNWKWVTETHLAEMIQQSDKQRFEIKDGRIRALYGHSIPQKITMEVKEPPAILYHGTARRFLDNIKAKGLMPMGRNYVHLSVDIETAILVGKRRDSKPVILTIEAGRAFACGVKFYRGNENTWLADAIEPRFIKFEG